MSDESKAECINVAESELKMTFRKHSLNYSEYIVTVFVVIAACFVMIRPLGIKIAALIIIINILNAILALRAYREFITIDEHGISCVKAGKELWKHEWSSIAKLHLGSRFMLPSIDIFVFSSKSNHDEAEYTGHYFQLGRAAKKALAVYAPIEIVK